MSRMANAVAIELRRRSGMRMHHNPQDAEQIALSGVNTRSCFARHGEFRPRARFRGAVGPPRRWERAGKPQALAKGGRPAPTFLRARRPDVSTLQGLSRQVAGRGPYGRIYNPIPPIQSCI